MAEETKQKLKDIRERLEKLAVSFDLPALQKREAEINEMMSATGFWGNQEKARGVVAELKRIKSITDAYARMSKQLEDCEVMLELAVEEHDAEVEADVAADAERLEKTLGDFEFKSMLNHPNDRLDAFVSIHAGAGGTESCDWAAMLLRMYSRWMERHGYEARIVDSLDDHRSKRALGLRLPEERDRRAPPRAHLAVRLQRPQAYLVRVGGRGA
jgi:peptide chain release factor 2